MNDDLAQSLTKDLTPSISPYLQSQIEYAFTIATFISILILVVMIWSLIRRHRVQDAIFRIDKNLQKLVDRGAHSVPQSKDEESKKDAQLPTSSNQGESSVSQDAN